MDSKMEKGIKVAAFVPLVGVVLQYVLGSVFLTGCATSAVIVLF